MAITSPSKRCRGDFIDNRQIGSLKCLIRERIENQVSDDKVGSYECLDCTFDQWNVPNIMEKVGPSSLRGKFSNGTSTMDINDKHFDDLDSDDKADSYLSSVGRPYLSRREVCS
ncbi:hypothetical protein Fot_06925 [Forsythia ovata]|uniref:Uncharacterized protein n=1 Tax=Forsythia ovata TaxID=205694 RepID=A0ABD1WUD3_9LAMI